MSWKEFEEKKKAEQPPEAAEWLRLHAAVFGSGPGADLLEKYHAMVVDRACGYDAPDAVLRWCDAQRALIRQMEMLTKRGQSAKS